MLSRKTLLVSAALSLAGSAPGFAVELVYREAAAPWSVEQAVKLPPAITSDFLEGVEKEFGASAAAGLAGKKEKVSGLVKRFKACALNTEDQKTADKYLTPDFKAEVRFFAEQGCAALRGAAAGQVRAAPQSASFSALQVLSVSGTISTYGGSAKFFDGASGKGQAAGPVMTSAPLTSGKSAVVQAVPKKQLSSKVPALRADAPRPETPKAERPAHFGEDRMVHLALAYWGAMSKENWAAFKKAKTGSDKTVAFLKAAAGAAFNGLLMYSNLEAVETDAARLGWDAHTAGAGAGAIAVDSAKLVFNSFVFIMSLAPLPILDVFKAAIAGEGWAIAIVAAMCAGTVNHYVLPIAD